MIIQHSEARGLCSKSEWELVESSFSPKLETLLPSDLKSRLDRARKLFRKTTVLIGLQHSDSRKHTTRRKTEMFAGAVDRFQSSLNLLENTPSVEQAPKTVDNNKTMEEPQTLNIHALLERSNQELARRERQLLPALAVHGEQQRRNSGSTAIQGHVGAVNRRQQGRRDSKNH